MSIHFNIQGEVDGLIRQLQESQEGQGSQGDSTKSLSDKEKKVSQLFLAEN
jgi:hypothetical protein